MKEDAPSVFLVNPSTDPVAIRIQGKANYLNCAPVGGLFRHLIAQGSRRFVIDFAACSGMDSTFLGIIAGTAIQLRSLGEESSMVLIRMNPRNLELALNLGLDKLLTVDDTPDAHPSEFPPGSQDTPTHAVEGAMADDRTILGAHEALSSFDRGNARKFKDVVSFLREQVQTER